MKPPEQWEEKDILALVENKAEESIDLEFKSAGALARTDGHKREISKDVSAFANSAGGTIVYGVAESATKPHYAESLTPIDPKEISKEWLEQVINSTIRPRIDSLRINPVELREQSPGKYCYVVCIPESYTAHQASDKKYYRRYNYESVPMEDYEVRQTMSRSSRPAYKLALHPIQQHGVGPGMISCRFGVTLENVSEIVGHDVSAVLFAPPQLMQAPSDAAAVFDGAKYARVPGTPFSPSHEQLPAIDPASPLTPYTIEFKKSLLIRSGVHWSGPLVIFVEVFDQFGLSLTSKFHVTQNLETDLVEEWQAAKRAPNLWSIGTRP